MKKHFKAVISFYQIMYDSSVESIDDIPFDKLELLMLYDCRELYRPYVVQQINKGMSTRAIARQTGLTPAEVRGIGRKIQVMS